MQYKIPIQIENEDTIVAGLSLRQLGIMMFFGGIGYGLFQKISPSLGETFALIIGGSLGLLGVVIALVKVSEMTFLPTVLNVIRLSLNGKSRLWSMGADSYSDLDIGYITLPNEKKLLPENISLDTRLSQDEDANNKIMKL